jgi:uncharacterized protein with GYD domain
MHGASHATAAAPRLQTMQHEVRRWRHGWGATDRDRKKAMSSYLMLFTFTGRGMQQIEDSPDRVEAAKRISLELGGEVKEFFGLLGRYDTMFIVEAPDDATAARISASIGKQGNVRAETLRAFAEHEYREILSGLR